MHSRIIFIAVFTIAIFILTFLTARVYSEGFKLSTHHSKNVLIMTFFVPLAFIASLIARGSATLGMSPTLYTIVNTTAGLFFFAALGAVILGLALIISTLTQITLPTAVAVVILCGSLLLGTIGIIQSRYIKIVAYTVTLPHAPESWNGKKAVLVSDTHFGLVNYKKFSDRVVNRILALQPDFVLHAGDFYDGPNVDTEPLTASWKNLTAKVPVFYAPGNHELYGNYKVFVQSVADAGVTVLENKKTLYEGVQIAGVTYHEGKESPETAQAIASLGIDASIASILINHPPTALQSAEKAQVGLMVSGHTHNGQFWPLTYVVRKVYGAYHYGHNMHGSMDTITTSGVGTWGPAIRLFNTPELVVITFKTN